LMLVAIICLWMIRNKFLIENVGLQRVGGILSVLITS
jgi:hypothetical protein